jgi:hypothetical protein
MGASLLFKFDLFFVLNDGSARLRSLTLSDKCIPDVSTALPKE